MCTHCGKIGHKSADCFTLERNKEKKDAYFKKIKERRANKTSNGGKEKTCFICGEKGHLSFQCPNKKKESSESANTAVEKEINLMAKSENKSFDDDT